MATAIKPGYFIEAKPNHTGFQALGTVKGKFDFNFDQTGNNRGRGILKTKYGDFTTYIHPKCREVAKRLYPGKQFYFLVWFRNTKIEDKIELALTVVGIGSKGKDNEFLVTGALHSWNLEENFYRIVLSRNFFSLSPNKRTLNFNTKKFRINVYFDSKVITEEITKLYKHKLIALKCKLGKGKLEIVEHQLISDELPDPRLIKVKKFKKKKRRKFKKEENSETKPLIRKKIKVGVIGTENDKAVDNKQENEGTQQTKKEIVEPEQIKKKVLEIKRKVLELSKK